jgi:hypothetical protein
MATMYLPSGDQRGEYSAREPGSMETWWVSKSSTRMMELVSPGAPLKIIFSPSGDQSGFC